MHSVNIHKVINRLISVLYGIRLWHYEDTVTSSQLIISIFYCVYHSLFALTSALGGMKSKTLAESIYSAEVSIAVGVLTVKLWILMRKQKQIMDLLNRICVFSIRCDDDFAFFNNKLEKFMSFVTTFLVVSTMACVVETFFPFVGSKKILIFDVALPLLDWRKSEIAFWITYAFLTSEVFLSLIVMLCSVLIWYLMRMCSLRYEVLGREIRNMGSITGNGARKVSNSEKQNLFLCDLNASIDGHLHLRRLIDELESLTSNLFLIQFATSGLSICGSIYCLAFDISENFARSMIHVYSMFYHISELFMITYLGNEILLSSDRITYTLFESNWVEQPQYTKKSMIIFAEYLRHPHRLLIGKLYLLTLETFTRILKWAYSLFNVLNK